MTTLDYFTDYTFHFALLIGLNAGFRQITFSKVFSRTKNMS